MPDKISGFFGKVIAGFKSETTPEEISEELKKEWNLMQEFFKLYEHKITEIKNTVSYWKSSRMRDIDAAQHFIKDIHDRINPELRGKLDELLKGIIHISRKIFARIKRAYNLKDKKTQEHLDKLNAGITNYVGEIKDTLQFLKRLYNHQSKYIKDKVAGQIEDDLQKHSFLYRTLTDELRADRKLRRNVIGFLRLVQLTIGIDRRSKKYITKIPMGQLAQELEKYVNRITTYVEGYQIEEILNPGSKQLDVFYEVMEKLFEEDPDMLDDKWIYRLSLNRRFMRYVHKELVTHIILLKKGGRLLCGTLIDFSGCDEQREMAIGILWFYALGKLHFREGFKDMMDFTEKVIIDDSRKLGYRSLGGVFFEQEKDKFYGLFKKMAREIKKIPSLVDIKYEQPRLSEDSEPVTNLLLFFYPMKEGYEAGIPVRDFVTMLRAFFVSSDCYTCQQGQPLEADPSYLKILRQLVKKIPENFAEKPNYELLLGKENIKPRKDIVKLIYV